MSTSSNRAEPLRQVGELGAATALPAESEPSFEAAFKRHYAVLRQAALELDCLGAVVAVLRGRALLGVHALRVPTAGGVGDAAVVGRHALCGVRAGPAFGVALRHVLLHARRGAEGGVVVRAVDLKSGRGFGADGVGACERVVTTGAAFLCVGGASVMVVPSALLLAGSPDVDAAWAELPRALQEVSALQGASGRELVVYTGGEDSGATTLTPAPRAALGRGRRSPDAYATLYVSERRGEAVYALDASELERGVLLGRYARCDVQLERDDARVSRLHVLLVKEGARVYAVDLASSHGLAVDDVPVELAELGEAAMLELGGACVVHWRQRRR